MPPLMHHLNDSLSSLTAIGVSEDSGKADLSVPTQGRNTLVRFADDATIVHLLDDVELGCKEAMWFTREEYKMFRMRDDLIVQLANVGGFQETEEHTLRGLENHTINEVGLNAMQAVMKEQIRQKRLGIYSPDLIATVAMIASADHRTEALLAGHRDAEEAGANAKPLEKPPKNNRSTPSFASPIRRRSSLSKIATSTDVLQPRPPRILQTESPTVNSKLRRRASLSRMLPSPTNSASPTTTDNPKRCVSRLRRRASLSRVPTTSESMPIQFESVRLSV